MAATRQTTVILVTARPADGPEIPGLEAALAASELALAPVAEEAAREAVAAAVARGDEPELLVISPSVTRPIPQARQLAAVAPGATLLFLAEGEDEASLQRELSLAPMIGIRWTLGRADDPHLPRLLGEAVESARQMKRLRTTLDRANLKIAAETTAAGANYRRLMLSDRYLSSLLDQARDAIIGADDHGQITSVNRAAERMFGRPAGAIRGSHLRSLCGGEWESSIEEVLTAVRGGRPFQLTEVLCHRSDGTSFHLEASVGLVTDEFQRPLGVSIIARDITQRKQAEEAALQNARQMEAIFRQATVGIALVDPTGRFQQVNARYSEIVGRSQEELLEMRMQDITHPDDLEVNLPLFAKLVKDGEPFAIEKRYLRPGGSCVWVNNSVSAVTDSDGRPRSVVAVTADITAKREAEAALRELANQREQLLESERVARASAEHTSRMKDEFLATLSHELRTPMNAILGWSQIIGKSPRNQSLVAQGIEVIERNSRIQAQIIDDLLDMSRIISGKVRLDVQRLDLAAVVSNAVETSLPTAEAKSIRLISVIDPLAGVAVSGDPNRLQQILWNLIHNAIKFTPKGGRVQVLLERVNSHVEISVIDNGEGIRPDFLPHVFDRFRQEDASTTRKHGGLGLGLSIVKQLTELHGGSVRVKSGGVGQGATFTVALPLTPLHPHPQEDPERRHPRTERAHPAAADPCVEIAGLRALVVDDEPDARALVKRLLEDCGATAETAGSAREAIELLGREPFDVMVSDVGMPGEDGYQLIRQVRQLEKNAAIPAIALTAYARSEDRVKAVSAGFLMHLSKPVEPAELIAMVAAATGGTGRWTDA